MTENTQSYSQMLPVGTLLQGGRYRIERYLSSGGFGNTYVAVNTAFDERVAVKEFFLKGISGREGGTVTVSLPANKALFDEQNRKFRKEALRLRKMKNDHIVGVHDLFEEFGTTYYVMDYLEGESVSAYLKRTGQPMDEHRVADILRQLLQALEEVHRQGLFHLDIKPANIMLRSDGHATLIDFGASKQISMDGGATTSTGLCYTPGYAPIEQMEQNLDKFGPWTDFYALGATLYYMLTMNSLPSPSDIQEQGEAALPMPAVSPAMQHLVRQLMRPIRTERPASVDKVWALVPQLLTVDGKQPAPRPAEPADVETPVIASQPQPSPSSPAQPSPSPAQPSPSPAPQQPSPAPVQPHPQPVGKKPHRWLLPTIVAAVVALLVIAGGGALGIYLLNKPAPSAVEATEVTAAPETPQETTLHDYQTTVGKCEYKGEVNEQGVPHGMGQATFADGRHYEGTFKNGKMDGPGQFTLASGDVFKGIMRNDYFYSGRYTATDGNYFEGTFEKGDIKNGTWYNKNGQKI